MAKKKMRNEETTAEAAAPSTSLKDLAMGSYDEKCSSGKSYAYDQLRRRKRAQEPDTGERIWFDDLPPHTD